MQLSKSGITPGVSSLLLFIFRKMTNNLPDETTRIHCDGCANRPARDAACVIQRSRSRPLWNRTENVYPVREFRDL